MRRFQLDPRVIRAKFITPLGAQRRIAGVGAVQQNRSRTASRRDWPSGPDCLVVFPSDRKYAGDAINEGHE